MEPTVTQRNPSWTRDEVVLACELVFDNSWKWLPATHPGVIALSEELRASPIHPAAVRASTFRNANSVARKTADIVTRHPGYDGKPTKGGQWEAPVLAMFLSDPAGARAEAAAIRDAAAELGGFASPPPDLDLAEATEGGVVDRRYLARERNPKLRAKKISAVLKSGGKIACEACTFDFAAVYGDRGDGYIEVHHRVPLHVSGKTTTSLDDLALLCSNCHRMVHRVQPWLTVETLVELVASAH